MGVRRRHKPSPSSAAAMLCSFLLLIFLPPCLGCQTSSFAQCQKVPFVPGHNLVGEGFDVVKLQTSGALVINVKDYMVGGVQGNCTVCHNSLLNQTQKLPVSVLDWRIKVGLGIKGMAGFAIGGSLSMSSTFAESRSRTDKFSFTSHEFKCKYYTFRLHSRPTLSKEFEVSLKSLPSTYDHKNTSAFHQFISIYGTHFIRRVHLGGRVHSMTAIRTCQTSMSGLSIQAVSTCLSAEASATIKGISVHASSEFCRRKSKSLKTASTFSAAFSDRKTKVLGGDGGITDILFNPKGSEGYKKWLASLKSVPGVVSYQISPLHLLIRDNPILKASLRDAISDYIRISAKPLRCPANCKIGHRKQNCACRCQGHRMVDSNCCPAAPGVAQMNVTVVRAEALWGDYFSKTDGYVKVFYDKQGGTTPVIWNNNFPHWNYLITFGSVNLKERKPVVFEVWDRDSVWDDDLLGKVSVIPTMGRNINKKFKLKHGSVLVRLSVVCGPSLEGSLCERYIPSPTYEDVMGYTKNH